MSKDSREILLRNPKGDDVKLILSSWLRSARNVGDNAHMSNTVYYGEAAFGFRDECVKKLASGFVTIACNPDNPDQIYGWAAAQAPSTLHYVYVKHLYRDRGIAQTLVNAAIPTFGKQATTVTTIGRFHREWGRKYRLAFDPYSWSENKDER